MHTHGQRYDALAGATSPTAQQAQVLLVARSSNCCLHTKQDLQDPVTWNRACSCSVCGGTLLERTMVTS